MTRRTNTSPAKASVRRGTKNCDSVGASPHDPVRDYANAVLAGEIIAGPHVRNACRRHLADLEYGPSRGLTWDLDSALRAINFFPDVLRLYGGQYDGQPFHLQQSQQFIVGSLFGWKRTDSTRRFRRGYIEEGKGNGKTPMCAGIGIYMMVADNEPAAEIYAAASKRDQAMILFTDAVAMRDMSPALTKRLLQSGRNPVWQLTDLQTRSKFKPLAADDSQSGMRPSCGLCDEVHEMKNRVVLNMLDRGFKHRRQPLLVMITNSGYDRKSVCWEQHERAVRVAAGTMTPDEDFTFVGEPIDDTTFSYVCALDREDDPLEDPSCWPKANPLLGVTMTEGQIQDAVRQANLLAGMRNDVLRLNFCVWTDSQTSWMSRKALEAVLADFDPTAEHAGKQAVVGIDLSASQDLTAMAFVVETGTKEIARDDGKTFLLPTFDAWIEAWTPADTLKERSQRDKTHYDVWVEQEHLNATPGKYIAQDFVAARLAEASSEHQIAAVAYDSYSFRTFRDRLADAGLTLHLLWHPQGGQKRAAPPDGEVEEAKKRGLKPGDAGYPEGLWMPGSLMELEQLILDQRIRLRRNPVLISACMSAAIDQDKLMGNRWLSKAKATNRIDPAVSLCMAVGAATRKAGTLGGSSVYDDIARRKREQGVTETDGKPAEEISSKEIDWTILNNPSHPRFAEMVRRWEAQRPADDEDL